MKTQDDLWLNNPRVLLNPDLLPTQEMPFTVQINLLSKLVVIIAVILLLIDAKWGLFFLIVGLVVLIGIYFLRKNKQKDRIKRMTENYIENYERPTVTPVLRASYTGGPIETGESFDTRQLAKSTVRYNNYGEPVLESAIVYPQSSPFYNDSVSIDPPSEIATSLNQNLANPQRKYGIPQGNPVTRIPPVVVPKSHDLSYWRDSELVTHSAVNKREVQEDMYLSGYAESTCCGYLPQNTELVPQNAWDVVEARKNASQAQRNRENYGQIVSPVPTQDVPMVRSIPVENYRNTRPTRENYGQIISPVPTQDVPMVRSIPVENYRNTRENYGNIVSPVPTQDVPMVRSIPVENYQRPNVRESYGDGGLDDEPEQSHEIPTFYPNGPGEVNTACGYNPSQIFTSGLPSNFPSGNCQQDSRLKRYNENLFTQTITPDNYMNTQILEPVNTNIGISFQQQFEPVSTYRDQNGKMYVQRDPRIQVPEQPRAPVETDPLDNIYDPRFYGYGTSYRSYIDDVTGQPRFMYDDVNAVKMPNYVTRSKIDFLPYADTYGPVTAGEEAGNAYTSNIRSLAQDSWLRNSLQFRDDMTEMLMRKPNAVNWQRRMYPHGPRQV